jgi:hypothetical protein
MSNLTNFLDDFTFEKPILFSTLMVQAILEGRKTQTRRVIKCDFYVENDPPLTAYIPDYITGEPQPVKLPCPYGQIGDRLWVRETFVYHHTGQLFYKTDIPVLCHKNWKWKPSIFMPRTASRITLEITDIRIERLQDISEEDCLSEGINYQGNAYDTIGAFSDLWDSINAKKHPWQSNPWVWVIEFKRIEK